MFVAPVVILRCCTVAAMKLVEDESLAGEALVVHPKFGAFLSKYAMRVLVVLFCR